MKTSIWIDALTEFDSYGELEAIIYCSLTDEPLAEVEVKIDVDKDELMYKINRIYENTTQTENEIISELQEHGRRYFEDMLANYYDELIDDGWCPDWGI